MNRNSIIDYTSCVLFKVLGFFARSLPKRLALFLGARLGDLLYLCDLKRRAIVYSNIKTAFTRKLTPSQLNSLSRQFYRTFGQNLIEIFFIPLVNRGYINKYIAIEGIDNAYSGFKKGKGVIFLGVHEGSWELSNVISASLGFPFSLFVRNQTRFKRIEELLNSYRTKKGCKLIYRQNQTRQLIETLKKNESIGMTVDQGGKTGVLVKFFGKYASMSAGAVKLSLKYGAAIIPGFYVRLKGPYIKVIIEPPFEVKKTGDRKKDIQDNLQALIHKFERYIEKYPKEYLWSYKVWKYSNERNILILSDGKTGHLRQAQSVAKIISSYLSERCITSSIDIEEMRFKNAFFRKAMLVASLLSDKYHCQGCQWCLRTALQKGNYQAATGKKPDIIISCGQAVAPINYVLSRENLAKSIVIMRPSILSTKRFNLVIMPKHDSPPKRKNIVATEGALNIVDEDYIRSQVASFRPNVAIKKVLVLGLLLGGGTKRFKLSTKFLKELFSQIKLFLEKHDGEILITTSRRTDSRVEYLVKEEFANFSRCKIVVIANENNLSFAVGGILGLSKIVIVSAESISMISEAVSSKRYVVVFNIPGLGRRHKKFLEAFAKSKYIYVCKPDELRYILEGILRDRPPIHTLKDNLLVSEAVKKIL